MILLCVLDFFLRVKSCLTSRKLRDRFVVTKEETRWFHSRFHGEDEQMLRFDVLY